MLQWSHVTQESLALKIGVQTPLPYPTPGFTITEDGSTFCFQNSGGWGTDFIGGFEGGGSSAFFNKNEDQSKQSLWISTNIQSCSLVKADRRNRDGKIVDLV